MFGLYIHIPYCIQRCHYCDFTTFEQSKLPPPAEYTKALCNEIKQQLRLVPYKKIDTIYFGGGTPSLLEVSLVKQILQSIKDTGLDWNPEIEITIEINPATIRQDKLKSYLEMGINRFSVGAQTFNDRLLKICGREHSANDTRKTLDLLQKYQVNYSFDLLFALPNQSIDELNEDLKEVSSYSPNHLSAYCLTLPKGHSMDKNRPTEDIQYEMFKTIEDSLLKSQIYKYEISNFSKKECESKHNLIYWTNQAYLGVGLSSHSYLPQQNLRFWNEKKIENYIQRNNTLKNSHQIYNDSRFEKLAEHERLTDFCHTALRLKKGLSISKARKEFKSNNFKCLENRIFNLKQLGLIEENRESWKLLPKGEILSNQVFLELTFLTNDISL